MAYLMLLEIFAQRVRNIWSWSCGEDGALCIRVNGVTDMCNVHLYMLSWVSSLTPFLSVLLSFSFAVELHESKQRTKLSVWPLSLMYFVTELSSCKATAVDMSREWSWGNVEEQWLPYSQEGAVCWRRKRLKSFDERCVENVSAFKKVHKELDSVPLSIRWG